MKTIIAITAIALSVSTPALAERLSASQARAIFALDNDSAAERIIGKTSRGDFRAARRHLSDSDSPAEQRLFFAGKVNQKRADRARAIFALDNDSAAERISR